MSCLHVNFDEVRSSCDYSYFVIQCGSGAAGAPSITSQLQEMTTGSSGCVGLAEGYLFDPSFLRDIPWGKESQSKFKDNISAQNPGVDLALRPLHKYDNRKGELRFLIRVFPRNHHSS